MSKWIIFTLLAYTLYSELSYRYALNKVNTANIMLKLQIRDDKKSKPPQCPACKQDIIYLQQPCEPVPCELCEPCPPPDNIYLEEFLYYEDSDY